MNLEIIYLLFWLYAFLGWLMESINVSLQSKKIINRGFLLGPYCPIYGVGGVLLLSLKSYQSDPFVVFILSIVICSIVEYLTSYLLELIYKVRWWDYSKRFLNLNGRVCLLNSIGFGLLGMLLVCFLNPFLIDKINSFSPFTLHILVIVICLITTTDIIITTSTMFDIRKTVVNFKDKTLTNLFKPNRDNTEEVSKKVRSILKEKSLIHKHLSKAYANMKVYKNNFLQKTEELVKYKKFEKIENIFVLSSIISLIIGLFLGKIFNKVGLFLCLCFSLNLIVVNYLNRRKDGK